MSILDYVFSEVITLLLGAAMLALFLRSLLTIISPDADGGIANTIFCVTDVLLAPARALLNKTGWFAGSPIDMSFLFTLVAIWILSILFAL